MITEHVQIAADAVCALLADVGGEHPLQFRPAPQNLVSKTTSRPAPVDHTHMSQEESNESDTEGQIYVPPRVQAMPYKEEVEKLPVKLKSEKHKLLRELRNEWAELPAEFQVRVVAGVVKVLTNYKMAKDNLASLRALYYPV